MVPSAEPLIDLMKSAKGLRAWIQQPNSDSYQTVTFTDPEEIKALGDITRNERMLYYDLMYEEDDLTVEVTVSGKTGKAEQEDDMENTYSSFFKKGEVPQNVKDRMGFW